MTCKCDSFCSQFLVSYFIYFNWDNTLLGGGGPLLYTVMKYSLIHVHNVARQAIDSEDWEGPGLERRNFKNNVLSEMK